MGKSTACRDDPVSQFYWSALRVKACDKNICETLELVSQMMQLADQGDIDREDVGCGVLYGTLRDAAFKIKKMAELEKSRHQKKGGWKG